MKKSLLILTVIAALAGAHAVRADANDTPEFLNSGKVLPSNLPFSEAVRVGNMLYLSGQIGVVPGSMKLASGGIQAETRQAMQNIKTALEAHGSSMDKVIKCTAMLADMAEWGSFNDVYKTFFTAHYPARSAFGATGLALGARVEVECVAVTGK